MINLLLAPKSEMNLAKSVIFGYKLEIREHAFSHVKLNQSKWVVSYDIMDNNTNIK